MKKTSNLRKVCLYLNVKISLVFLVFFTLFNVRVFGYEVITDSFGIRFSPSNYTKIVSLAPSITEILSFIGVDSRIVGVTRYCKLKDKHKKKILGGVYDPDIEGIIYLKPDIVFMLRIGNMENYYLLLKSGINVFTLDFAKVEDIFHQLKLISKLLMVYEKSSNKIYTLENYTSNKIKLLRKHFFGKKFLFIFSYPTIYTSSSNSYLSDLIRKIGGLNVSDDIPSKHQTVLIDIERILEVKPDFILISENNFESITNELYKFGLNSKYIYLDPMDISPSIRITNFLSTLEAHIPK